MASSRKCHVGLCGPCSLCHSKSIKYTHPEKFDDKQYTFLCKVENKLVDKCACICYACSKQLKRNLGNPKFEPRWRTKYNSQSKCSIHNCENLASKKTSLASGEEIERLIGEPVVAFTVEESVSTVSLCQLHYNHLYRQLNPVFSCDSCGGYPRKGEKFNRHCPESEMINTYLASISDDPPHLTEQSLICAACYVHFKATLKRTQVEKEPSVKQESTDERNADINQVISLLSSKMSQIYDSRESATMSDYLEYVACKVCKKLGECMKKDEALLLPSLHKEFANEAFANLFMFPQASDVSEHIPTSRWLLSQIHLYFGNKIEVQCCHKRYGTLLFHKSCDLIKALSTALGKNENIQRRADNLIDSQTSVQKQELSIEEQAQNVAIHLNGKLHERARVLNADFNKTPEKIASTNLATVIASTDPLILKFLTIMTQSARQSRRSLFESTVQASTKNIRLLYALSVLQFCTNSTCSAPLHILLTESVICHGGTLELVRILNRLGAAASIETVNRLATHVVQTRLSQGIKPDLEPNKLAVVSIDNIDILQPYAFVSCQDATRSWHGTSVQCVQPLPVSGHLTQEDLLASPKTHKKRPPTSPAGTPIPTEKHKRRRRTLTELASPHTTMVAHTQGEQTSRSDPFDNVELADYRTISTVTLHLEEFKLNAIEQSTLENLQTDLFQCIVLRGFGSTDRSAHPFPALPSLVNCIRKQSADREVSNVTYVEIISERADSKPTLIGVIGRLQQIFIHDLNQKYVIVVGDAKTYNLLQDICYEYKSQLKWLIPYPGDWHVLFNYQKALMKPYADAGLASLGKASGHRAETLTTLMQAKNFRRTHEFLLQTFEAFYRYFLSLYVAHLEHKEGRTSCTEDITALVSDLVSRFTALTSDDELDTFRHRSKQQLESETMPLSYRGFTGYMDNLSKQYDTVKFWYQFITVDCFAYIALFFALRYRNWELRMGSVKVMAPTFSAFDRSIYQELIPHHLKDMLTIPSNVLHHLRKGSFSVRLSPTEWHGIALDECHEMRINKDAKLAVIHPSKHKMEFLSNYLSFRAACVENLKKQLFPECDKPTPKFSHSPTSKDKKRDLNIQYMLDAIESKTMLTSGLYNFLELKQATPEQAHDLLNFRKIGVEALESFISTKLLGLTSTTVPTRRKRLCTFSVTQTQKRRLKLVEHERKISQRFLKRQLAWISERGSENIDLNSLFGPISSLPSALIGKDGLPYKASKSTTTDFLRKRYSTIPIITQSLPYQWIPNTVILEGMFLIQTSPIPTMTFMQEYTHLLLNQYIRPHFRAGVQEVHVIFDSPGSMRETPKELEQRRRDSSAQHCENHECVHLSSTTEIPSKWRALLACRKCKQCLTQYLGHEMLKLVQQLLSSTQSFVCNIGEVAYCATSSGERLPCPQLWTNADEADLRVWLHCVHSAGTRKLIFSPDTDVYHAGLTVAPLIPESEIIVQLSKTFKEGSKFLHMNRLLQALQSDPDLFGIPPLIRPQAIQTLYVCTGCDYVSFFAGMGKVTFLSSFYKYASFIAGYNDTCGSIGEVNLDTDSSSCLSFFRLVGCTYFGAHASAFELPSPIALYHSITERDVVEHHNKWLGMIRKTVWLRADAENKNVPSTDALKLHWRRSLWVIKMWHKAVENDIDMPGLDAYGWSRQPDGKLEVVWDTVENQTKAKERIEFVLKGCKCKTGCTSKRCKCKKSARMCGPGCQCLNCLNTSTHQVNKDLDEEQHHMIVDSQEDSWESDGYVEESDDDLEIDDDDDEVDEIMDRVFGAESDPEET